MSNKQVKYQPIGNNLLLEAIQISTSIVVPGSVEPEGYTVVATGEDVLSIDPEEKVIISPNALVVPIRNTNYVLTNADNVLCVVE